MTFFYWKLYAKKALKLRFTLLKRGTMKIFPKKNDNEIKKEQKQEESSKQHHKKGNKHPQRIWPTDQETHKGPKK